MKAIAMLALLAVVITGCATKPKGNRAKCDSVGGVYNSTTKVCQFQSGD